MAPLPGVGKKAMSAVRAVRTLHEGCQCSGWCEEMDKQIFVCVSKRPVGESIRNDGGLKGYSGGSSMRPWKMPPCRKAPTLNPECRGLALVLAFSLAQETPGKVWQSLSVGMSVFSLTLYLSSAWLWGELLINQEKHG